MAKATIEMVCDNQAFLALESPLRQFVPVVGGDRPVAMPFDDAIYGNACTELDRASQAITLEYYRGLPVAGPAEFGYRPTWRAQIMGGARACASMSAARARALAAFDSILRVVYSLIQQPDGALTMIAMQSL